MGSTTFVFYSQMIHRKFSGVADDPFINTSTFIYEYLYPVLDF